MQLLGVAETPFMTAYARILGDSVGKDHRDNYDWRRFGPEPTPSRSPRGNFAATMLKPLRRGVFRSSEEKRRLDAGLRFAEPHAADLEWLYERLDEDQSRKALVQLIAFRALGYRHVKLPLNQSDHWRSLEAMEKRAEGRETIDPGFLGWRLPKLDLRELGYPIELFSWPTSAVSQFVNQQYRCETADGLIDAKEGDIAVDAGGCWADTALYFADRVGSQGRVYSFEFLPDNLEVYQRNLKLNPELASRIELLPHPVWSAAGEELFISQNGPGTTVGPTPRSESDKTVRTVTIDQLLERPAVNRVDFIKMDIEGAELPALRGAEAVLRRFRPQLAITVYHSLSDFWEIPQYLDSLGLGYRFYLRHFTIHAEETVLFATCDGGN